MTDAFPLPEPFKQRVVSVWREDGALWLERLPALVDAFAERWGLSIESVAPELSYNVVASAVMADGREAVLKLGVPNPELRTEVAALQAFQGGPVVQILAADDALGALLLGRLDPGRPLSGLESDEEATAIGARLIRDLPVAEPSAHGFPTVGDWARAFERLRARFDGTTGPLPAGFVDRAEGFVRDLDASSSRRMLLHGDLHHDNILSNGESEWLAIDPKGVIGDLAYEAARFQHNPIPRFLAMDRPREVARRRATILSEIVQEEKARLLAWAFVDAMLSACWSLEEHGDWRYAIACAEVFEGMV